MQTLNAHKTGLTLAFILALMHLVWSFLVFIGWAQPLITFSFQMHMIGPAFTVEPFDSIRALGLIAIAAGIGYIAGNVIAHIWNKFQN